MDNESRNLDLTFYSEHGFRIRHIIGMSSEVTAILQTFRSFFDAAVTIRSQETLAKGRSEAVIAVEIGSFTGIDILADYHRQQVDALVAKVAKAPSRDARSVLRPSKTRASS